MKRSRSQRRIELDTPIINRMVDIKKDHPNWGYRRVWAYIRYRDGVIVGKNRIYRLMSDANKLVPHNDKIKASRTASRSKPVAKVPNQFWGTDMTKIYISSWGWVYLHVVLDWFSKEIIGHHLSMTSKSSDWQNALNMAVQTRFPNGIFAKRGKPKLISDNGCQPTSTSFMKACSELKIKQIFTSWNNPKGNADTERLFRTIKEDLVWPNEWTSPFQFQAALDQWVVAYNTDFPHQSLRYKTPAQFNLDFARSRTARKEEKSKKYSLSFA